MKINQYPKISVVTPNYNQVGFIEKTILSVLSQQYPNLEYIIIDGGSTDGSVEIIQKYANELHYWISEKDNGMYEAINKGFKKSSGDIMYWINSDDITFPNSLFLVAEAFQKNTKLNWLMGYPSIINEQGQITWQGHGAPVYSRLFYFSKQYLSSFSFIQQESTFWRRNLWDKAGAYVSMDYSLASDFDLWMRFFKYEKLHYTHNKLGAFRVRSGQKSENKEVYIKETKLSLKKNQHKMSVFFNIRIFIILGLRKMILIIGSAKLKNIYNIFIKKAIGNPNWID